MALPIAEAKTQFIATDYENSERAQALAKILNFYEILERKPDEADLIPFRVSYLHFAKPAFEFVESVWHHGGAKSIAEFAKLQDVRSSPKFFPYVVPYPVIASEGGANWDIGKALASPTQTAAARLILWLATAHNPSVFREQPLFGQNLLPLFKVWNDGEKLTPVIRTRNAMREAAEEITGETPEEWVQLPNHDKLAVDHALLEEMNAAGETHVFVKSVGKVPVRDLLDGVNESEFHLFLSHNSKDKSIVREIRTKLLGLGVRCWFDEVDIGFGKNWQRELAEGIDTCPCIAVMLGPNGSGPWQSAEMQLVQDDSVKQKKLLIPVLLPGVDGFPSDLPAEFRFLKNFKYLDFGKGLTDEGLDRLANEVLKR